jgi:hypothetical protein
MSQEHDHSHGQEKDPGHTHHHECCGHDHHHAQAPGSAHDHSCCGHDHDHDHTHSHSAHGCCGHDHGDAIWTRRFFTFLQGIVLFMIGGIMVYFVASGRIDGRNPQMPYVTGWFKGLALCGGLGLMVLGLFNWLTSRRDVDCGHDHDHDPDHNQQHTSEPESDAAEPPPLHTHEGSVAGRALTLLVLSGSIAAAAVLTPDALSSRYIQYKSNAYGNDRNSAERLRQTSPEPAKVASQPGGFTLAKVEEYIKRTKEGNFPLSVVNLHYMGADQEYATVMDGQPVETTGQVVKDELNPGPGNLRVFVTQVTCCAADARPYSVPVIFDGDVPDYVEMGWYKVKGKLEFIQERGMKMARLHASGPEGLQATIRPDPERPGI